MASRVPSLAVGSENFNFHFSLPYFHLCFIDRPEGDCRLRRSRDGRNPSERSGARHEGTLGESEAGSIWRGEAPPGGRKHRAMAFAQGWIPPEERPVPPIETAGTDNPK